MNSDSGTAGGTDLDASTRKNLAASIAACLLNGQRLIDESHDLEFREPPASQYYLIMIAQEEFAKAFLLYLVREGAAPFSPAVRRAIKNHVCKQLLGIVLDYMIMHWDEISELEVAIKEDSDLGKDRFPNDVGSALEVLCYEKIGRWGDEKYWSWAEDPAYDPSILKIAEGKKDQRKQDALYVRIGGDGRPCQTQPIDLPPNSHPIAIRAFPGDTPSGADRGTGDRRSWSGLRSRSPFAVRSAACAAGVR